MEDWEEAWLVGSKMPPYAFPRRWIEPMYTKPYPESESDLYARMAELFTMALSEWRKQRERYGELLEGAP